MMKRDLFMGVVKLYIFFNLKKSFLVCLIKIKFIILWFNFFTDFFFSFLYFKKKEYLKLLSRDYKLLNLLFIIYRICLINIFLLNLNKIFFHFLINK
jgi:hypothetical protein